MTQTATVTWDLPTTRVSGNPLDPATLVGVDVYLSADLGANFTLLNTVAPVDPQMLVVPDLVDGDYIVRLEVRDLDGQVSVAVDTSFLIDLSAPDGVTNVVVSLA